MASSFSRLRVLMLAEAFLLQQALEESGISPPRQHPRVKVPGATGACLRVRLSKGGGVSDVEEVSEDEWAGFWTIMEGNHNSFPIVRLGDPLIPLPSDHEVWTRLVELGQEDGNRGVYALLSEILDREGPVTISKKSRKLWQRLAEEKAAELVRCAVGQARPEAEGLEEFGRRFQSAAAEPERLLGEIAQLALQRLREGRLASVRAVQDLLIGGSSAGRVQLAFDLTIDGPFPRGIYTDRFRTTVIGLLPIDPKEGGVQTHPARECAFTGESVDLQTSPFPKVRFPVLNKDFPLFSMFSDARCNTRYGMTDSEAVPVAADAARGFQDALSFIVDETRRGQTWEPVASGKFEKQGGRKKEKFDLLIAFLEGRPEVPSRIAALFGSGTEEDEQFEADASAVCAALRGIQQERPASRLNLFVLRKMSEGQAQVDLAERPTVESVLSGVEHWRAGARNVPTIVIPFPPPEKGGRAEPRSPTPPSPSEAVQTLSEEWIRGGTHANKVAGVRFSEVLTVLLQREETAKPTALRLLDLAVQRAGRLILGFEDARRRGRPKALKDFSRRQRRQILRVAGLLGIFLSTLDKKKDDYMKEPMFLVGRLLSLADSLHVRYCEKVRGGAIPPQLIGNSLMPVAAEAPQEALDRLRERMNVYVAWAKQASTSKKGESGPDGLTGWLLGKFGAIARELADAGLPDETDATGRAVLFLGYMAREERSDKEPVTENDQENSNG